MRPGESKERLHELAMAMAKKERPSRGTPVRMEDPALKELGYNEYTRRSFHGIPLRSVYKSKSTGKHYAEGDLQLARTLAGK